MKNVAPARIGKAKIAIRAKNAGRHWVIESEPNVKIKV